MATGNMYKNLVKFDRTVFELCVQTETDRQMDIFIIILSNATGTKQ